MTSLLRAILVMALIACAIPIADAAESLTFTASVTSGDGSLTPTLTWLAPGASGCTASGHSSWTGSKPASGTATLPTITMSGTYQLSLSCTWPADSTTKLTWVNPTKNTDGSAFTDPKLIRIRWGSTASTMNQTTDVAAVGGALPTTYTFTGLPAGERLYTVSAVNQRDVESAPSNTVSKVTTGSSSKTETVPITINPVPDKATGLTIE